MNAAKRRSRSNRARTDGRTARTRAGRTNVVKTDRNVRTEAVAKRRSRHARAGAVGRTARTGAVVRTDESASSMDAKANNWVGGGGWVTRNQEHGAPQANERQPSSSRYGNRSRRSYGNYDVDDENPETEKTVRTGAVMTIRSTTRTRPVMKTNETARTRAVVQTDKSASMDANANNWVGGGGWMIRNQEDSAPQANERRPSSSRYENRTRRSYGYHNVDDENPEDDDNETSNSYGYYSVDGENQEDGSLQANENYYLEDDGNQEDSAPQEEEDNRKNYREEDKFDSEDSDNYSDSTTSDSDSDSDSEDSKDASSGCGCCCLM